VKELLILSFAILSGCNSAQNKAVNACETFIKDRLRSPSTYKRINVDGLGPAFENEGHSVKMVTIEYDAANAYGTPIRGSQQCTFEVDKSGNFKSDPQHAAEMASIASSEFAPCCVSGSSSSGDGDSLENAADDLDRAADEAIKSAEAALAASAEAK
jgi:hypothetical protein